MATVTYYARWLDAGHGVQNVTVVDGVVVSQTLVAGQGEYTGDGNPLWVGKPKSILRGKGFEKVRAPRVFNDATGRWQLGDPDDYWQELEAAEQEEAWAQAEQEARQDDDAYIEANWDRIVEQAAMRRDLMDYDR